MIGQKIVFIPLSYSQRDILQLSHCFCIIHQIILNLETSDNDQFVYHDFVSKNTSYLGLVFIIQSWLNIKYIWHWDVVR